MAENLYMMLLSISVIAVAGVLIQFIWGWVANQPEMLTNARPEITEEPYRGPLQDLWALISDVAIVCAFLAMTFTFFILAWWPSSESRDQEKKPKSAKTAGASLQRTVKVIRLDRRLLQTVDGELRDAFLARPEGAKTNLTVMSNFLCAFDDGKNVYYNRREMLRSADQADVGQWYWLMLAALAIIIDALLPGIRVWLREMWPAFETYPWLMWIGPQMALYVLPLAVLWFAVRAVRSLILTARVEKAVRPLMTAKNQNWPDQAVWPGPLTTPEIDASEMATLAGLAGYMVFAIYQAFLLNLFLQ